MSQRSFLVSWFQRPGIAHLYAALKLDDGQVLTESMMMQLWWAFMAGSFAVITYRNTDNDAGILQDLLENDLHVGELRDEDLALQIRLAVGYRTALETTLRTGGRDNPPYIADTLVRLDDWLSGLGRLARRVDHFRTETAFQAGQIFDLRQRIAALDTRVAEAIDVKLIGT